MFSTFKSYFLIDYKINLIWKNDKLLKPLMQV